MIPYFSLIAPVFNTPNEKLERCINSIIAQTYSDFELLLIDDGSSTECADFLDKFAEKDKRIQIIHKQNGGSSIARNVGIEYAKGKYISFIDSDDFIMPYALDDAKKTIDENDSDFIIGLAQRHYEESSIVDINQRNELFSNKFILQCNDVSRFINHILGYTDPTFIFRDGYIGDGPWARFCKAEIVKNTLFGIEGYCSDDTIWNLQLLPKCKTISIVKRLWYMYMINENSKTRKFRPNSANEVQFRIEQEYSLATIYNPECKKGVYLKIWRETDTFGRSFLFNKKNSLSFLKKYKCFRDFIKTPIYDEMLHNITFERENNYMKYCLKKICRFCAIHGPRLVTYFAWYVFVRKSI